ncbi:MAG: hypothetical protein ABI315_02095, partial [Bacteroidia bacterium]
KGADKEVNSSYTAKGLLTRITYPTKGYSNFIYEPNTYRGTKTVFPPINSLKVHAEKILGDHTPFSSSNSTTSLGFDQKAQLDLGASLSWDSGCEKFSTKDNDGNEQIDFHIKSQFSITDLTSPSNNPNVYQITPVSTNSLGSSFFILPKSNYSNCFVNLVAGHSYQITINANWECITSGATLTYYQGTKSEVPVNLITGGVRIQKVETNDNINATPQIIHYYYGKKDSPDISTGEQGFMPRYYKFTTDYDKCTLGNLAPINHFEVSSNSLNALYNSIGENTVGYHFVTVSNGGDNFENGGEEHEFILDNDAPVNNKQGDYIPSAPWSNIGFQNGTEKTVNVFKKSGTAITVLKTQSNNYIQDPRYHEEVFGYVVQKKYDDIFTAPVTYTCTVEDAKRKWTHNECITTGDHKHNWAAVPGQKDWVCIGLGANNQTITTEDRCFGKEDTVFSNINILDNLNISEYTNVSRWEYLNSTTTTTYDENGQNPTNTTTTYEYANPIHLQPTTITTSLDNAGTSNPHQLITHTLYPQDYNLTGTLTGTAAVLKNMADRNMINVPIEQTKISVQGWDVHVIDGQVTTYKMNNNFIAKDKDFKLKFNNSGTSNQDLISVEPSTITTAGNFTFDSHYEEANACNTYDTNNNLLELKDRKNLYSFIREPGTGNVWAKTLHTNYNDIAYSSFEHEDVNKDFTHWWYTNTNIVTLAAFNGNKALKLKDGDEGYVKSIVSLSKYQNYKISFWAIDGAVNVNTMEGEGITSSRSLLTLRTGPTRQGWTYYEGVFSNAILVILSGTATIDELRLYPVNARMHTYVHKMAQGIISECNENNQKTDYLYDEFNRLKLVKDQDGNILKKNEYKYQATY